MEESYRPYIDTRRIRSFGRVKSRKLNPQQERLIQEFLPQLAILPIEDTVISLADCFAFTPEKIVLEIGFGGGEHIAGMAINASESAFIGCEPFTNGVASFLKHIEDEQLQRNIRIFHGDARLLLESCKKESLDEVYILFPDPWPKVKHHKKRIINHETLSLLYSVMKEGATLTIATDHVDYAEWIAKYSEERMDFREIGVDRHTAPRDWIPTRYQQKALEEGRSPVFFILERQNADQERPER